MLSPRIGILADTKGTRVLGTTHGTAESYWSNSKCGSVVVCFATFRAGENSRFFCVMFGHLFGVVLSHLLKEGFESMAATLARQVKACLPAI
jgi:hypothetical protein